MLPRRIRGLFLVLALATAFFHAPALGLAAPASPVPFPRDLKVGTTGNDVLALQRYLNTHGAKIAATGPGSPGHETSRFGLLTRAALTTFQKRYLAPRIGAALTKELGILTGTTRQFINTARYAHYSPGTHGTLTGTTSQMLLPGEEGSAITATPDFGYFFDKWSDGSHDNPRVEARIATSTEVTALYVVRTGSHRRTQGGGGSNPPPSAPTYALTYTAGAHGSISGNTTQTVTEGDDGSTVTAVPDEGYGFVSWSDNVPTANRTDTNIREDHSLTASFLPQQPTPTFSEAAGSILFNTTVTLSSASADAIYYTTNGITPSRSSTNQAATPLVITGPMTVKALAVRGGYADSIVASAEYTGIPSRDLTTIELSNSPSGFAFSPATYSYTDVTVSSDTASITVTPTGSDTLAVDGTAVASGQASASIALTVGVRRDIVVTTTEANHTTKTYTIGVTRGGRQATPTFSPSSSPVDFESTVVITSPGADAIYYTTDGSEPTTTSTNQATTPLVIHSAETVRAIAVRTGFATSAIGSATYTQAPSSDLSSLVLSGSPANYSFIGSGHVYTGVTAAYADSSITFTPTGSGTITVDGTPVTSGDTSSAIALSVGVERTVLVVVTETHRAPTTYTLRITRGNGQATPTFSPAEGAVAVGTPVTISSLDADAIYYTTDGSTPTTDSTNQATTPLVLNPPVTVKALAVRAGYANSAIGSATYSRAYATAPSVVVLRRGDTQAVSAVTNVTIPAPGATDTTGVVYGWVTGQYDTIKFSVTDSGSAASTITIDGTPYVSGTDYTIATAATVTIVVTTSETNRATAVRTFEITVVQNSVGDAYQGGVIAYLLQPGDAGYDASVQKGFIVSTSDQSAGASWGGSGTYNSISCNGAVQMYTSTTTALGDGLLNTTKIIARCPGSAAGLAAAYVNDSYDDWHLPSKDELAKIYAERSFFGISTGEYWSSSESGDVNFPWSQDFSNAAQLQRSRATLNHVRAIRSFTNDNTQRTPTFSTAAGPVALGTAVTIRSAGATAIYYTTDGSTPTRASANQADTPLVVSAAMTVKALAVRDGYADSAIGTAVYTQALASTPSAVTLSLGAIHSMSSVISNVSLPAAGATDSSGSVSGWISGSFDTIAFTVSDSGSASSLITINGSAYSSGEDYVLASPSDLTVVVTTSETGKVTQVRTFIIAVSADFGGFTLTTPTSAFGAGTPSRAISITVNNGPVGNSTASFDLSDGGAGGTFYPAGPLTIAANAAAGTVSQFLYTPPAAASGPITIQAVATGGISATRTLTRSIGTASKFVYDTYTDTAGTSLTSHTPNLGAQWVMGADHGSVDRILNGSGGSYDVGTGGGTFYRSWFIPTAPAAQEHDVAVTLSNINTTTTISDVVAFASTPGSLTGYRLAISGGSYYFIRYVQNPSTIFYGPIGSVANGSTHRLKIAVRLINGAQYLFAYSDDTLLGTPIQDGYLTSGYAGQLTQIPDGQSPAATDSVSSNFVGSNTDWTP